MFRISLIVCVLLTLDVTAKPWSKLVEKSMQEAIVSLDDKGKMSWAEEVEAPEDMDGIQYIIDPGMKIWKGMTDGNKKPLEPEEDLDEVYHKAKEQLDVYAPLSAEYRSDVEARDMPFERDELYRPAQNGYEAEGPSVIRVHLQPEEDLDDLYHKDPPVLQQNDVFPKAAVPVEYPSQRKYTEPEEDLDDLHHQ